MSEWRSTTLGKLVEHSGGSIQTGPFGSQLHASDYVDDGIPSVMPVNIGENVIVEPGIARVGEADAKRLSRHRLAIGDIVYSRRGDVERRALVRAENAGWLCGTGCLRVHFGPTPNADSRFVSYLLGTEWTREWIRQHAVGATMPNLNTGILAAVPLMVPDLPEQRAIADVLGALDDKIAANTKLAAIATELLELEAHDRWFGLRDVARRPVTDFVEFNPVVPRPSEALPVYVDMRKLPESGAGISEWDYREAKGGTRFLQGDTLLARITPCLENRKTGWVDFLSEGQVGVGSTEFIGMRSRDGIAKPISYFVAVDPEFRSFAIQHMVGTSGRQRVSASDLAEYMLPMPDEAWLGDFGQRAESTFAYLKSLRDENRTLAATRDALLPQLMSGKLRVRDVEAAV